MAYCRGSKFILKTGNLREWLLQVFRTWYCNMQASKTCIRASQTSMCTEIIWNPVKIQILIQKMIRED